MIDNLLSEDKIKYSIIIPVLNEEESISDLFLSLKKAMDVLNENYEIIFINDGSTDYTLAYLNELLGAYNQLRIANFSKNRGQGRALEAGFQAARGDVVISMDGDLQNDPQDIPKLIHEIERGFDLVCGWRYERNDAVIKKIKSKIGNFIQRIITRIVLHDMSCTFRAYRRNLLSGISLKNKFYFSFLPYIICKKNKNIKIAEVKIHDHYRRYGSSKYKFLHTTLGTIFDYARIIILRDF